MIKEEKLFSSLFGKVISDVRVNKTDSVVQFLTECGETHYYFAEGDCCSESWFEKFEESSYLFTPKGQTPRTILDALVISCNCDQMATRQDEDKVQHVVFIYNTSYGSANTVVMNLRNSSNGFYNGSICYLGPTLEKSHWAIDEPEKATFRSVWR